MKQPKSNEELVGYIRLLSDDTTHVDIKIQIM